MSIQTRLPLEVLADCDWETLRTYEDVLAELNGRTKPADGYQTLLQQVQKYGG